MSNISVPEIPKRKSTTVNPDIPGRITGIIGSGKHAQDSIVWYTIQWSFAIGIIFSFLAVIGFWLTCTGKNDFPIDTFKSIWNIFIPIITLALGYIFGKQKT